MIFERLRSWIASTSAAIPSSRPFSHCPPERTVLRRKAETYRNREYETLRRSIQEQRRVAPLPNGRDGGLVQQWYGPQNAHVFDASMTVDNCLEDDDYLHLCADRERRVLRLDACNQRRRLQLTAYAHRISRDRRCRRRRWWQWRRRSFADQSTHDPANHATRNPSFDSTRNSF